MKLKEDCSVDGSDYINASYIIDTDPQHPKYIATQAPLKQTIADFWQVGNFFISLLRNSASVMLSL